MLAPIDCYAVNINDIVLLQCSLNNLAKITKHIGIDLVGSICNGDAGFDSKQKRIRATAIRQNRNRDACDTSIKNLTINALP